MPQSKKKFIITQDQSVSNILIAHGFRLLSNINGTYTFENKPNGQFNFEGIDVKKIAYTNILSL